MLKRNPAQTNLPPEPKGGKRVEMPPSPEQIEKRWKKALLVVFLLFVGIGAFAGAVTGWGDDAPEPVATSAAPTGTGLPPQDVLEGSAIILTKYIDSEYYEGARALVSLLATKSGCNVGVYREYAQQSLNAPKAQRAALASAVPGVVGVALMYTETEGVMALVVQC